MKKNLEQLIAERKRAGLSLREISAWLKAKHGIELSHVGVKDRLDKLAKPKSKSKTPRAPPPRPARERETLRSEEEDDVVAEPDLVLLDQMIDELDDDIETARVGGAIQAVGTFSRLKADLIERRRKLRPPPPPDESADAEARGAGDRAISKLEALIAAEERQR